MVILKKICIDCKEPRLIYHNAQRCYECAIKRRKQLDTIRYKRRQIMKKKSRPCFDSVA